jgi:hypothetical protein
VPFIRRDKGNARAEQKQLMPEDNRGAQAQTEKKHEAEKTVWPAKQKSKI